MVEDRCTSQVLEEVEDVRTVSCVVEALVVWEEERAVEDPCLMVCGVLLSVVWLVLLLCHESLTTALEHSSEGPRGSGTWKCYCESMSVAGGRQQGMEVRYVPLLKNSAQDGVHSACEPTLESVMTGRLPHCSLVGAPYPILPTCLLLAAPAPPLLIRQPAVRSAVQHLCGGLLSVQVALPAIDGPLHQALSSRMSVFGEVPGSRIDRLALEVGSELFECPSLLVPPKLFAVLSALLAILHVSSQSVV
jgi:hypothetical protein